MGVQFSVAIPFDPGQVSTSSVDASNGFPILPVAIPFDPGQVSTAEMN